MRFSVIIPALNEEQSIRSCIQSVRAADASTEVIVVDGGSTDRTPEIVLEECAILCRSNPGRGIQLNSGASNAQGDILVFLHADSTVSLDMFDVLRTGFARPEVKIGTCTLRFDIRHPVLTFYEVCARFKSVFTTFGDQCIVVRRSFFRDIGGFPSWRLFEDVRLLQNARSRRHINTFPTVVTTSARKFVKHGFIRQQIRNAAFMMLYLAGVSPDRLAALYSQGWCFACSSHHDEKVHQLLERNDKLSVAKSGPPGQNIEVVCIPFQNQQWR